MIISSIRIFEIFFVACLSSGACRDIPIQTLDREPTFFECYKETLPIVTAWLEDHPEYKFRRITCGPMRINL